MRTVDLFSGCGGLSLGFQNAGFEIVAAFDQWKAAVKVYIDNFLNPYLHKNQANKPMTLCEYFGDSFVRN